MSIIKLSKRQTEWDTMIADAQERIERLQTVIAICRENKIKGEPWPGSAEFVQQSINQTHHTSTRN
jgi:hypothetical protein